MKEKGITLISLVVTIIVLIILSGVSISMLIGENGVITKAKEAKSKMEIETLVEAIKLKVVEKDMEEEYYDIGYEQHLLNEGIITDSGKVNIEKLNINISTGKGSWTLGKGDIYQLVENKLYYYPKGYTDSEQKVLVAELWQKYYLTFDGDGFITGVRDDLIDENGNYLGPKEIVIPKEIAQKKITGINQYAFQDNKEITSIRIEAEIETIEEYAFKGCTNLQSINIPSTVTTIGEKAFYQCTNLNNIVIPASVTSIGDKAFADDTSLANVTIEGNPTIGTEAFRNCPFQP